MSGYLEVEHCGQTLWLLADKALYWPARHTLLVADVHIGKAASYRALHQPVPRGQPMRHWRAWMRCWRPMTASSW